MAKARKNPARFDHANNKIILYKWFDEKARSPKNKEFKMLVEYTRSFPTYKIEVREDINTNNNQEHYKGLSYDYMKEYIKRFEPVETRDAVLKELDDKLFISECHSKAYRYPEIKNWFLKKYPEIVNYGMPTVAKNSDEVQEEKDNAVIKIDNAVAENDNATEENETVDPAA
ncbi:MAG: hypothetical protein IJE48_06400 [Clostridia bacterium]|nr:hypothetical protein [Clostridia bacterium]